MVKEASMERAFIIIKKHPTRYVFIREFSNFYSLWREREREREAREKFLIF